MILIMSIMDRNKTEWLYKVVLEMLTALEDCMIAKITVRTNGVNANKIT